MEQFTIWVALTFITQNRNEEELRGKTEQKEKKMKS